MSSTTSATKASLAFAPTFAEVSANGLNLRPIRQIYFEVKLISLTASPQPNASSRQNGERSQPTRRGPRQGLRELPVVPPCACPATRSGLLAREQSRRSGLSLLPRLRQSVRPARSFTSEAEENLRVLAHAEPDWQDKIFVRAVIVQDNFQVEKLLPPSKPQGVFHDIKVVCQLAVGYPTSRPSEIVPGFAVS
jgi:hypothetical protein